MVDDASGDDSLPRLREAFRRPKWRGRVEVVDAGRNGGFGSGVNVGVRRALAVESQRPLPLHPQPRRRNQPGALLALGRFMDEHPDAGMLGNEVQIAART